MEKTWYLGKFCTEKQSSKASKGLLRIRTRTVNSWHGYHCNPYWSFQQNVPALQSSAMILLTLKSNCSSGTRAYELLQEALAYLSVVLISANLLQKGRLLTMQSTSGRLKISKRPLWKGLGLELLAEVEPQGTRPEAQQHQEKPCQRWALLLCRTFLTGSSRILRAFPSKNMFNYDETCFHNDPGRRMLSLGADATILNRFEITAKWHCPSSLLEIAIEALCPPRRTSKAPPALSTRVGVRGAWTEPHTQPRRVAGLRWENSINSLIRF